MKYPKGNGSALAATRGYDSGSGGFTIGLRSSDGMPWWSRQCVMLTFAILGRYASSPAVRVSALGGWPQSPDVQTAAHIARDRTGRTIPTPCNSCNRRLNQNGPQSPLQ